MVTRQSPSAVTVHTRSTPEAALSADTGRQRLPPLAAAYSQVRTFGIGYLGGDTYRYSQYATLSGFYDIIPDFRIGAEYIFGTRTNYSGESGKANRIMAMIQYSF